MKVAEWQTTELEKPLKPSKDKTICILALGAQPNALRGYSFVWLQPYLLQCTWLGVFTLLLLVIVPCSEALPTLTLMDSACQPPTTRSYASSTNKPTYLRSVISNLGCSGKNCRHYLLQQQENEQLHKDLFWYATLRRDRWISSPRHRTSYIHCSAHSTGISELSKLFQSGTDAGG